MQFDTIDEHFVPYAESYEDSTFILILHHIQINVIPMYMLHVGTVKSMYLRRGGGGGGGNEEKKIYMSYIMLLCIIIYSEP